MQLYFFYWKMHNLFNENHQQKMTKYKEGYLQSKMLSDYTKQTLLNNGYALNSILFFLGRNLNSMLQRDFFSKKLDKGFH